MGNTDQASKKLAIIMTGKSWGGLEMNALKLVKIFHNQDSDLTIIARPETPFYTKASKVVTSVITLPRDCYRYLDFSMAYFLSKEIKIRAITHVLIIESKDIDVMAWTKRLFAKNLRLVFQQHMQLGIDKKNILQTFRFKQLDAWISPLPYLKEEAARCTYFPKERIYTIPIGIDKNKVHEIGYPKKKARDHWGISHDVTLLGIMGRITEKKGQLFVVEAIQELQKKHPNLSLLIVGSPSLNSASSQKYYEKLQSTIHKLKQPCHIYLHEFEHRTALFYSSIDAFVLASEKETYGMVTLEAMLAKLPIIAPYSGGGREILKNGQFGRLYKDHNHQSFQEQVTWILENPKEAQLMATNAQRHAKRNYSIEIEINGISSVLQNLS